MSSRSEPCNDLPQPGKRLLGRLLDLLLSTGSPPPALQFRAENYAEVSVLDELEARGLLRRADNGYVMAMTALPLIGTEAAALLLQRMERVYAALRERYRASQEAPVTVSQLAAEVQLPVPEAAQVLRLMEDVSLWNRGRTTDLMQDGAYVIPSEDLLKYASYAAMLREVRGWSARPAGGGAIFGDSGLQRLHNGSGIPLDEAKELPAARAEALLALASELDSLEFSLNTYYDDLEPQGVIDRLVGGKIKALVTHCEVIGWPNLAGRLRELLPVEGSAVDAMDMIRSFVLPEIRRLAAGNAAAPAPQPTSSILLAWPAVRACVSEFSFNDIKEIAGLAGLDLTKVAQLVQKAQAGATKGQLLSAVDGQFGAMSAARQKQFLTTLIEEILRRQPAAEERLAEYLTRLGWSFVSQTLVPLEILDAGALEWTPQECRRDLLKAAQRFRDGDLTGSISAACGAVDSATSNVYAQFGLGEPTQASFQERCRRAAQARGVVPALEQQLRELGWLPEDIRPFQKNLEGALNQGAYVLQTLRSHMGDVHGSKPILAPLVFDCLRWAELLVASLTSQGPETEM